MSRILKRPMFRTGGSTNEGIMHGLVDRKGFDQGSIDPKRTRADVQTELDILSEYAPMPTSRFPLGSIGLNLVSGEYAGDGLLANVARSMKGPYSEWTAKDDLREQALMQRRAGAAGRSIAQQRAEYAARLKAKAKAAGQSGMQKDFSTDRKYFQLLEKYSEAPKDRYSKTITNLYPHGMAEFGSRIQDNAYKSKEGVAVMQNLDGVVPHEIKGGQAQWQYEKMDAGAMYYHPQYKAFVQREPRTDDAPEQLIVYDPYTFKEVRRVNLG